LDYRHNNYFGKWGAHIERNFPLFPLAHLVVNIFITKDNFGPWWMLS
jgi:hypothetical protein